MARVRPIQGLAIKRKAMAALSPADLDLAPAAAMVTNDAATVRVDPVSPDLDLAPAALDTAIRDAAMEKAAPAQENHAVDPAPAVAMAIRDALTAKEDRASLDPDPALAAVMVIRDAVMEKVDPENQDRVPAPAPADLQVMATRDAVMAKADLIMVIRDAPTARVDLEIHAADPDPMLKAALVNLDHVPAPVAVMATNAAATAKVDLASQELDLAPANHAADLDPMEMAAHLALATDLKDLAVIPTIQEQTLTNTKSPRKAITKDRACQESARRPAKIDRAE